MASRLTKTLSAFTQTTVLIMVAVSLNACNGHSTTFADDDINLASDTIVQVDDTSFIGQSAELALFYPDDQLSNIEWQQTAGEAVTLLSKNTKVIAFTPESAGDYTFTVSFSVNGGATQTLTHTLMVNEQNNKIATRLAHSALSKSEVSLRAFIDSTIEQSSIQWQQTSGTDISFTQSNVDGQLAVFFTAPNVAQDTLFTFAVSAHDDSQTYTDKVVVLVEPARKIASNAYFDERLANVFPYNANSPYADDIVSCVYSNSLSSACTLATLPLLASQNSTLTIDDIMDRVVVSHAWMAERFKTFLINNDPNDDFKNLLRATTAIVIAYDIRPSFYWAATGAIYLDADNFWLTAEERDTINEAPDYRSDYGKDLQFVMPWRYVKDNDYADQYFPVTQRLPRTASDGFYGLASLLYHELAHANDFFPSTEWFIHDQQTRILDAALDSNFESDGLSVAYPLQSSEMRALAQVSYLGETPSSSQIDYLPSDIETFFSPDRASGYYAYTSEREDYAMLFEELMMQTRFGVYRDVAITNQPSGDNLNATDYIVTWGQRGRIGEEKLKARVAYSASRVLTEFDSSQAITQLAAPVAMMAGNNWLENLTISPTNRLKGEKNSVSAAHLASQSRQRPLRIPYYHKALPNP